MIYQYLKMVSIYFRKSYRLEMEKDKFVQEIEALLHDNGAIKGTSATKLTK